MTQYGYTSYNAIINACNVDRQPRNNKLVLLYVREIEIVCASSMVVTCEYLFKIALIVSQLSDSICRFSSYNTYIRDKAHFSIGQRDLPAISAPQLSIITISGESTLFLSDVLLFLALAHAQY